VRRRMMLALASSSLFAAAFGLFYGRIQGQPSASPGSATPADYAQWKTELKNWGRWGSSDQRGASNLITSAKVQNAARLVKSGTVVSLAHAGPQKPESHVLVASYCHRTSIITVYVLPTDT